MPRYFIKGSFASFHDSHGSGEDVDAYWAHSDGGTYSADNVVEAIARFVENVLSVDITKDDLYIMSGDNSLRCVLILNTNGTRASNDDFDKWQEGKILLTNMKMDFEIGEVVMKPPTEFVELSDVELC